MSSTIPQPIDWRYPPGAAIAKIRKKPRAKKRRVKKVSAKELAFRAAEDKVCASKLRFTEFAKRTMPMSSSGPRPSFGTPTHTKVVKKFCLTVLRTAGTLINAYVEDEGGGREKWPAVVIDVDMTGDTFRVMFYEHDAVGDRTGGWDTGEERGEFSGDGGYWIPVSTAMQEKNGYDVDVLPSVTPRWCAADIV